jgi:hypothetical protein
MLTQGFLSERIFAFAQCLEQQLKTAILGDEDSSTQWALPYDADSKTVRVICLDNNKIKTF